MRRRRVLAIGAAAVGFSGCIEDDEDDSAWTPTEVPDTASATDESTRESVEATSTSIGASLNGRPFRLEDDLELIERSNATWLHAFLDVRKKYDGGVTPEEDPDVVALRRASQEMGVKLIVSLQWDFIGLFDKESKSVPPADSDRERALFEYATEMLTAIEDPVDVVVLGNEPIWETLDDEVVGSDSPLIPFTLKLKDHLLDHYTVGDPRLFVGAFNRLYIDHIWEEYGAFYRQLFDMARTDDDIDGIDLHVHYADFPEAEAMLDAARRAFPDGAMIVTEFSPMWRYDRHKNEPITSFEGGKRFADRYGIAEDVTVTEYLEAAKDDRLSREEMGDFMETMPWYNVDFVEDMYDLLKRYDVEVGTFGFLVEDDVRHIDWTEGWAPFPINCLFQPALIDSEDGAHPHYLDDFRDRA